MGEEQWNKCDFLTLSECARVLRCSQSTVYRAVHEGRLGPVRLRERGSLRIPFFRLEELVRPRLLEAVEEGTRATSEEVVER